MARPTAMRELIIDPRGNLRAHTANTCLIVSSKALSLASSKLAGLVAATHASSRRILDLTEDFEPAVNIVLNILHFQSSRIPQRLTLFHLSHVAAVCRKYDCIEPVRVWVDGWMKALIRPEGFENSQTALEWLGIAYTFREEKIFRWASKLLTIGVDWDVFEPVDRRAASFEGRRVFVGNLPPTTTEVDLLALFGTFSVEQAKIPHQSIVRFGFVSLVNRTDVDYAVASVNRRIFRGHTLKVEVAREMRDYLIVKPIGDFPSPILADHLLSARVHILSEMLQRTKLFYISLTRQVKDGAPCLVYGAHSTTPERRQAAFCEALTLGWLQIAYGKAHLSPQPKAPFCGLTVWGVMLKLGEMVMVQEPEHDACRNLLMRKKRALLEAITREVGAFRGLELQEIIQREQEAGVGSFGT